MAQMQDQWWVSRQGQTFGPVSFAQLKESADAGRLEPRTDLVYGGSLAEWVAAHEVDGLFERKQTLPAPAPSAPASPGQAPAAQPMSDSGNYSSITTVEVGGIGRLGYIIASLLLPLLLGVALSLALSFLTPMVPEDVQGFLPLIFVVVPVLTVVLAVMRFQNVGMSGWWWLGMLVPLLNLWLSYRLFACPPGYAYTNRLDGPGKFLAALFWLSVLAAIALPVVAAFGLIQGLDAEELQAWISALEARAAEIQEDIGQAAE